MNKHHVTPKARGGKGKKTVYLPEDFHEAWHLLFKDLKPGEIKFFIRRINMLVEKKKEINQKTINKEQKRAKKTVKTREKEAVS